MFVTKFEGSSKVYLTWPMQARVSLSMWRPMLSSPLSSISRLLAVSHRSTLLKTRTSCSVTRSLEASTWTRLSSCMLGQSMLSLTRSKFHLMKLRHWRATSL